jgi:hypothetical protein
MSKPDLNYNNYCYVCGEKLSKTTGAHYLVIDRKGRLKPGCVGARDVVITYCSEDHLNKGINLYENDRHVTIKEKGVINRERE